MNTFQFLLGKLVWLFLIPGNAIALLAVAVLLFGRRIDRTGFLRLLGAGLLFCIAVFPVGDWALVPLERCAGTPRLPATIDGILVLSGAGDGGATLAHGDFQFNDAADRFYGLLILMHQLPNVRIVYTGGSGVPSNVGYREADYIKSMIAGIGLDASRIVIEDKARNTLENAQFTRSIYATTPAQSWLLVTSAFHMPRALALFRKQGEASGTLFWPYSVDYRTSGRLDVHLSLAFADNLVKLNTAAKEYAGMLYGWALGHAATYLRCEA